MVANQMLHGNTIAAVFFNGFNGAKERMESVMVVGKRQIVGTSWKC